MASEDAFNAALSAFTFFGAYLGAVAEEIGMERALGLLTKMCESMGTMQGQILKQQAKVEEIDAKAAWALIRGTAENLGMNSEVIEESPQRVVSRTWRCPIYDSAQMLGMDARSVCRAGVSRFDEAMLKALNPNLSYQCLSYRSSAEGFCDEAYVVGKPYSFPE